MTKIEKKKAPTLRFPEFTEDWEQRKLGDITEYIKGYAFKSKDYQNDGYKIIRVSDLGKDNIKVSNDSIFVSEEIAKQQFRYAIQADDIIITTVGSKAEMKESAVGRPIIVKKSLGYLLNQNLVKLYGKSKFDNYFIYTQLLQTRYVDYISMIERGNANQANIAINDLWKYQLLIPIYEEQQNIGTFFKRLDDTIALHQRKLDLLKEQKKGYLQKMFPKNGAKVPELRFAGFADDWEERKLKELFQPSKNKNNNGLYNQKDILAASLGTELIPKRTFFGLKSTKESVKNYRIVKTGDLIYTKSPIKGFPNGIIRSNKGNVGIVPPLYCVYTLQKDINSSIIQLYFEDKNRLDFYLFPLVNVGARNNVNITDLEFLEGKVTIPKSYEEQSKIVQFMEQLNRTIDLHQRKLDLLKEQKKGFLQKMFV
ncbi:MAG: restriction endonuclease subunit S [Lactococcus cremoris]